MPYEQVRKFCVTILFIDLLQQAVLRFYFNIKITCATNIILNFLWKIW